MAEMEVKEGIKVLKDTIELTKNQFIALQDSFKDLGEPMVGMEVYDIKFIQATLDILFVHLKAMSVVQNDQLNMLELIWQRLDEK